MATIGAIFTLLPAFLQALPYILQIVMKMMDVTIQLVGWAKQNNFNNWILDLEATTDALKKATTPDEKWEAGKKFGELIGKLPPLSVPK